LQRKILDRAKQMAAEQSRPDFTREQQPGQPAAVVLQQATS
jgi:hypothetical protein